MRWRMYYACEASEEGHWHVELVTESPASHRTETIGRGLEDNQQDAEVQARLCVEKHKQARRELEAKRRAADAKVKRFRVRA